MEKELKKVIEDFLTVKAAIHLDRPIIEVITEKVDEYEVLISLDNSVNDNGERWTKRFPINKGQYLLELMTKDVMSLMHEHDLDELDLNYRNY